MVERRRRGDEKEVQERKEKAKLQRREERQIDRDEKHPQKQQKVPAEEQQWPENMPEWEERKSLLAQRRVESVRLLTVLLNRVKRQTVAYSWSHSERYKENVTKCSTTK